MVFVMQCRGTIDGGGGGVIGMGERPVSSLLCQALWLLESRIAAIGLVHSGVDFGVIVSDRWLTSGLLLQNIRRS